jgi:hypothetical protein
MAAKIGTGDILFRVGSGSPSKVFLGSTAVQNVPGAPTILSAGFDEQTDVGFTPPNDGGSAITAYKFYFDGVELTPDSTTENSASFSANLAGQDAQVAAVNAIGEGPKSATVTVVAA